MNLNYSWNGGSLAGMMLASQMLTGILLAMHYVGHIDHAFTSVQHLMTDVPSGMILRYAHANGASLFFIVVYLHVLRGIYYGSGAQPREMVWISGVVILLLMIITAFIGYVLPWGNYFAQNNIVYCFAFFNTQTEYVYSGAFYTPRVPSHKRIGPHSLEFVDIAIGLLLSDGYAEKHGQGVRLSFKQGACNKEFFNSVAKDLYRLGYISQSEFQVLKTTDNRGTVLYYYKLNTFVFGSLFWLRDLFYVNKVKVIKPELEQYLTARALAYWIGGDGGWEIAGMRLHTQNFQKTECDLLVSMLERKFGLECTVQQQFQGNKSYCRLHIKHKSMPLLRSLVKDYLHPSMHYKIFNRTAD
jgi:hypothetical protein